MNAKIKLSELDLPENIDWRVPLKRAGVYMHASIDKNFRSQGRPKRWKKLSAKTLRSRRRGSGSGSPKILMDTGRLRGSVTTRTSSDAVYKLTDKQLVLGTNVEYARLHQHGHRKKRVPKRPFLGFQKEDITFIEKIFEDYVATL